MAKVTLTLSEDRFGQLSSRAAVEGRSLSEVVEAELERADSVAVASVMTLLDRARAAAAEAGELSDEDVMKTAIELAHEVRDEMAFERS